LISLDRGEARFLAWVGLAVLLCILLYSAQLRTFFELLGGRLDETFGTAYPAIPFATLLTVLFLLRWKELHAVLLREAGFSSRMATRALGLLLLLLPLAFGGVSTGSLELSAVSLILAIYGASLMISPLTLKILLPYALLYSVGVTLPGVLQSLLGEPLAGFSSFMTAGLVRLMGIPVAWNGLQLEFISRVGGTVSATITPGCSSILSVTTFLGLLGLMYMDLKKRVSSTLRLAFAGVLVLMFLNSLRIGLLVWIGYYAGEAALWSLHNWIGYALFLGFYLAALLIYVRMGDGGPRNAASAVDFG
jgi:exosortase/archaeosortase family protein